MRVLVVNAGSSSLKLRFLDAETLLGRVDLEASGGVFDEGQLAAALDRVVGGRPSTVDVVGHRVVHGGIDFAGPVVMDERVRLRLEELADLAPLHQGKSLAGIDAVTRLLPGVPAVACFDTAFHAQLPAAASTYAVPRQWRERYAVRRYGFHGLSHAYATRRGAAIVGRSATELRMVTCHLGAGASLAAVRDGISVDTTMGFTPLEGLVMATRSGSVDPGLVLWLQQHERLSAQEVAHQLEHGSGLLALAGTADMRAVLAAEAAGEPDGVLALGVYVHRLRASIAAMVAALGGLDVLVFTGGVGERSAAVRARTADGLGFLGVTLGRRLNEAAVVNEADPASDAEIGDAAAAVRTLVVAAREDLEIAREVRLLLGGSRQAPGDARSASSGGVGTFDSG